MTINPFAIVPLAAAMAVAILATPAAAADAPATIKVGQTMPYSGPASAYAAIGKASAAYFRMINDQGGVNGRMIELHSLDDGYSPPKTLEQTRKLVEETNVLLMFGSVGTPTNNAVRKYLNDKQVPQLFVGSGATMWGDPARFPWTMGWQPSYQSEAQVFAAYIKTALPNGKIAVLYQNDDYGKDYLAGLKNAFGAEGKNRIIAEATYEAADATVDSQIIALQASGADVFVNITNPKAAAQAIRKAFDIGWHPTQFLNSAAVSVDAVLAPAGLERSAGVIAAAYFKDPSDPQVVKDPAYADYAAFVAKYLPESKPQEYFNVYGYSVAQTLVQVLKQCGNDLSRANVMRQAANLQDLALPMLLPGIKIGTTPTSFFPIHQMTLQRFDGKSWVLFGPVING
jgi:branched-chain amino acid transport system substrate-binding protein